CPLFAMRFLQRPFRCMFSPARNVIGCVLLALAPGGELPAQHSPAVRFEEHLSGSQLAIPDAPPSPGGGPPAASGISLESLQQMALDRHPALAEARAR